MKKNPYKGKFILLEGVDGSGKTTQAQMLGQRLIQNGFPAFVTREPTSETLFGKLARFIYMCESLHDKASAELHRCMEGAEYKALRAVYNDAKKAHINRLEEIAHEVMMGEYKHLPTFLQLCMMFDRYHHHVDTVIPKLQDGITVVADRDFLSTLAYSAADDIQWRPLLAAHEDILGDAFIMPDQMFVIDIPAEVGVARTMHKQSGKKDYFDTEAMLGKVRERYLELSRAPEIITNTACITISPGYEDAQGVHELIWPYVESLMVRGDPYRVPVLHSRARE